MKVTQSYYLLELEGVVNIRTKYMMLLRFSKHTNNNNNNIYKKLVFNFTFNLKFEKTKIITFKINLKL